MATTYFTQDFLDFFKELAANNHKDWFDDNRKRYDKSVKEPFKNFVSDLINEVHKHDKRVGIEAKDAIFRINRDIRFSKDKAPYKLNRTAVISSAGRKDHSVPGFYVLVGPEKTSLGGGAYFMKPDQLQKFRAHLAATPKEIEQLLSDKRFKALFGEIKGEENKRVPKEFKDLVETQPLLLKKQFYYMVDGKASQITKPDFMDVCLDHYHAAYGVQEYLTKALA